MIKLINLDFDKTESFILSSQISFYNKNLSIYLQPSKDLLYSVSLVRLFPLIMAIFVLGTIVYYLTNRVKQKNKIIAREFEEKAQLQEAMFQNRKLKALGRISGGVAHDFNNIIQNIQGHTEILDLLAQNEDLPLGFKNDFNESLKSIMKNVGRTKEITSQILAFSRANSSNFKIIDVSEIIKDSIQLVKETADRRITFTHSLNKQLILGNETLMVQILMNLLINAIEAIKKKPGEISIVQLNEKVEWQSEALQSLTSRFPDVEFRKKMKHVIKITDNGVGMNQEQMQMAFDPFYTTKSTGTGLGLGIVHQNVTNMGGEVNIVSNVGIGTTFELNFPCPINIPDVPLKSIEPVRLNSQFENIKILIVDDEEDIRSSFKTLLTNKGFEVNLASDGEEGWDKINSFSFDLVIIDVNMPKLNGIELYKRILNSYPKQKVIFLSGFSQEKIGFKGINVLNKPIDINEFISAIKSELNK